MLRPGDEDRITLAELMPPGYQILHVPRTGRKSGGVAVVCRKEPTVTVQPSKQYSTFEHIEVLLRAANKCYHKIIGRSDLLGHSTVSAVGALR